MILVVTTEPGADTGGLAMPASSASPYTLPSSSWYLGFWEPSLALPLVLGLGIRLLLLPWFSDAYNFFGSYLTTEILLRGIEPLQVLSSDAVFGELNPWGYPGLYFSLTLFAHAASWGDPFLYGLWLKVPATVLDLGTAIILFRIARLVGSSHATARFIAIAFLFNPFSILATSIWGVNDPLSVFFTVLGLYLLLRNKEGDLTLAGVSIGVGIALKLYPVLLLPLLLARAHGTGKTLQLLGVTLAIPILTSIPFLVTSGSAYLGILFGFASGADGGGLDPQRTILAAIHWLMGPLDPRVAPLLAVVLLVVLVWVYRATRHGRLHPILAAGVVLLVSFILTVRWIPNYALWAVPFTTLQAFLFTRGWQRWIPGVFWVPAMVDASIYMGWYPDRFSGVSGIPYWALVANGPGILMVELLPSATFPLLVGTFLATTAATLYLAIRSGAGFRTEGEKMRATTLRRYKRLQTRSTVLALLLLFLVATIGSSYFQYLHHGPVTPRDFASFVPDYEGTVSVRDDFRARFLSFRWTFGGNGRYALHPNGINGILLDTLKPTGTAYLEDPIEADRLEVRLTFHVRERYGTRPLIVISGPGGWLGVKGPSTAPLLVYFNEIEQQTIPLGRLTDGWQEAALSFSADRREVQAVSTQLLLDGAGPVRGVRLGHDRATSLGGGVLEISMVTLDWSIGSRAPEGPPLWTVVLSGFGVVATLYVAVGWILGIPKTKRHQSRGDG